MIELIPETTLTAVDEVQIASLLSRYFDTAFNNRS